MIPLKVISSPTFIIYAYCTGSCGLPSSQDCGYVDLKTLQIHYIDAGTRGAFESLSIIDTNTIIGTGAGRYYIYHVNESKWDEVLFDKSGTVAIYSIVKYKDGLILGTNVGLWASETMNGLPTFLKRYRADNSIAH